MLTLLKFISTLLFASFVAGQLTITKPSTALWWISNNDNELSWTCKTSDKMSFTVLVNNPSMASPLAIIAIQNNYDCSVIVPSQKANLSDGRGWTIQFANILNSTDVYATSEVFEVKGHNEAYPTGVSTGVFRASGSSSGSSPSATSKSSGTISLKAGLGVVGFTIFATVALFA